jgi:outer membrane protein assembly factor BamB
VPKAIKQRNSLGTYRNVGFLCLILVLTLVLSLLIEIPAPYNQATVRATSGMADWPTYLHDTLRTNDNSAETTLSASNAGLLTKQWSLSTPATIEASAIVSNGSVYSGSWDGNEYALNEGTGAVEWKTFLGQTTSPQSDCNPPYSDTAGVSSSPTIANGIVYLSGGDSNFYALDATTGAILWSVLINNTNGTGYYNYSSPIVANGYAYVGLTSYGNCPSVQGAVVQIDVNTHQIVHRFNVVPDGAGGPVWSSPAFDPATNTIYVTTGEDNGTSNPQYTDSILALSGADLTLEHAWMIPHDGSFFGDADFGAGPVLFSDSTGRTLVGAANKNGYFYALDRSTFQLVWSYQVGDTACGDPVQGCGSISPAAFANDTIYVAGGHTTISGASCPGSLRALKADNGQAVWQYCEPGVVMGAVAYANGILAVGVGNTLEVHNAATGALLYSYQESTDANVYLSASPTIANGQIFEGYGGDPAAGGALFAFGLSAGTPTPSVAPATSTMTATPTLTPAPSATPTPGTVPAFVQVISAVPQTNQTTVSVAYPSPQHGGDTNIVAIGWNDITSTISAVSDSAGNTYQAAAPLARGSGLSQAIYYAKNIVSAPANGNTVTVTFTQPATSVDVRALEYSGLDPNTPFDAAASAAGSASRADSGAATTHAANELLVGAGTTSGAFGGAGSGYTVRIVTSPDGDIAEDQIVTAAGSYHATAPVNQTWVMQLATFRAATGGAILYPRLELAHPTLATLPARYHFGLWDAASSLQGPNAKLLSATPGSAQQASTTGFLYQAGDASPSMALDGEFLSAPLAAQTIPAGTWSVGLGIQGNLLNAGRPDYTGYLILNVVNGSTGQVRGTLVNAPIGAEKTTAGTEVTAYQASVPGAAVTVQAGDYLEAEVGVRTLSYSAVQNTTLFTSGTSAITADGVGTSNAGSFIQAPVALTFQ